MNINDEKLSAFLDSELSEKEMQAVRDSIANSEKVADRLAELAQVDSLVYASYAEIDDKVIPHSINQLLSEDNELETRAKVIEFPRWKKISRNLTKYSATKYSAVAACALVVLGLSLANFETTKSDTESLIVAAEVSQVLFDKTSGTEVSLANGKLVLPKASFKNKAGESCRLYNVTSNAKGSENIACLKQGQWKIAASFTTEFVSNNSEYQTASRKAELDQALDKIIQGSFYNRNQEEASIEQRWK
ncbi:anti-sigma factor family protein [Aliikangiella sp. IMCC44632]